MDLTNEKDEDEKDDNPGQNEATAGEENCTWTLIATIYNTS